MAKNTGFKMLSEKEKYVTGRCILQYSNLKDPYSFNEKDEPKFSITILIPKQDSDNSVNPEIKNINTIIKNHWKQGKIKIGSTIPLKSGTSIIEERQQEDKPADPKLENYYQFRSSSKYKPVVVTANPKIKFTGEESELRGYWCRVSLEFYAYKTGTNQGVTTYLKAVQVIEPSNIDIPGIGDPAQDFGLEEVSKENKENMAFTDVETSLPDF